MRETGGTFVFDAEWDEIDVDGGVKGVRNEARKHVAPGSWAPFTRPE